VWQQQQAPQLWQVQQQEHQRQKRQQQRNQQPKRREVCSFSISLRRRCFKITLQLLEGMFVTALVCQRLTIDDEFFGTRIQKRLSDDLKQGVSRGFSILKSAD
jgi:hypothetical protein